MSAIFVLRVDKSSSNGGRVKTIRDKVRRIDDFVTNGHPIPSIVITVIFIGTMDPSSYEVSEHLDGLFVERRTRWRDQFLSGDSVTRT